MTVTQTPSAREPQAIAALREKVGNGWREHGAKDILAAYDALVAERDAVARERDSLRTALMASPDEMTVEFCKLVDCVKEEMADKRELLHRLNTDPDTTKALLLKSDQLLAAAERERDALRGVVEKARQLDAVVYGNRPGGAGSFDERHRAQVEFIDALRALDENNKS